MLALYRIVDAEQAKSGKNKIHIYIFIFSFSYYLFLSWN